MHQNHKQKTIAKSVKVLSYLSAESGLRSFGIQRPVHPLLFDLGGFVECGHFMPFQRNMASKGKIASKEYTFSLGGRH